MISNEEFLKECDAENVDWDNLPDLESAPDVYVIEGCWRLRKVWSAEWNSRTRNNPIEDEDKSKEFFEIGQEYQSYGEAHAQVQSMKIDPKWCEERLIEEDWACKEYRGPVIFETIRILKRKPSELVDQHIMKKLRADILAGKDVFPMYLP